MTTETVVSTVLTNLNASPLVRPIAGEGGPAVVYYVNDNFTTTTGDTGTYRCARFPRNAHVKHVKVWLDGSVTTLTADINVAWSNSTVDGTQVTYQGTVPQISAANNKLFGAAQDLHDTVTPTDFIAANTTNFPVGSNMQPLWQVLGYTVDPGGFFDLYFADTTANSGGAKVNVEVAYTLP